MRFSAATALDQVRSGSALAAIAGQRSMQEIHDAVRDAKTGLRLGLTSLSDEELHRTGPESWSVAMLAGHALVADEAAHRIARSLALGRVPGDVEVPYDRPGDADASRAELLAGIAASEERLAEVRVLAAGGPQFAHRDFGPLDARGWILFIGVHDAMHLHQAAAIVRGR